MHIGTPEITSSNGVVTWATPVDAAWAAPDRLWFSLPEEHAGLLTDLADPALLALLIPAMHEGDALIVEAPVSDELAHNLRHSYQQAMCQVIGGLSKVRLEIRDPAQARDPKHGVGTGFSAGVDSFAVVVEHRFSPVPPDLQLSHLTFFNVGSHGRGEDGRRLFRSRFDRLTPVAGRIGLPFVPVDSNLDDFYRLDFRQTHGPRTIAAASLLQGGLGRYYFAGSLSFEHLGIRPSRTTAYADPILLPLLSTKQFRPVSHGDASTRVEKTLAVAAAPLSHSTLDVCAAPLADGTNCTQCSKCLRTAVTLDIAGLLDDFAEVFDLGRYEQVKAIYLQEIAVGNGEYATEIREFARACDYPLPGTLSVRLRRAPMRAARRSRSLAGRARSRLLRRASL